MYLDMYIRLAQGLWRDAKMTLTIRVEIHYMYHYKNLTPGHYDKNKIGR